MKLSLRKAHRLVKDLQNHLSVRDQPQTIHHSADEQEILDTIDLVESRNAEAVYTALHVVEAISAIRAGVQALNAKEVDGDSVDSLLNKKVQIESKMRVLAAFAVAPKDTQEKRVLAIKRQVQDAASNAGQMYSNSDVVVRGQSISTQQHLNDLYVALKQEQEVVSDKLAYINNLLQVEIDDSYADLFKKLQVL
ncbi:hypothetical protein SEPL_515 [Salmonella phage SE_PL]|nr:hypothetical protein [Salmonella enterica]ELL7856304.1 hypothetical protein [Salmonella enterica]QCW18555.1 hypothetical protein 7t3_030 [Salmonella phage 7t3]QIG63128.1 hypothetical protein SEPL_515 [Salmonella phage SE_PL]